MNTNNSIQYRDNSLIRNQDENNNDKLIIKTIFDKLQHLITPTISEIIQPQALFYNEKQADELLTLMRDKLPPASDISSLFKQISEALDHTSTDSNLTQTINSLATTIGAIGSAADTTLKITESILGVSAMGMIMYSVFRFANDSSMSNLLFMLATGVMIWMLDNTINPFTAFKIFLNSCWDSLIGLINNLISPPDERFVQMESVGPQSFISTAIFDSVIVSWLGYIGLSSQKIDKKSVSQLSELLRLRTSLPDFLDSLKDYVIKFYNSMVSEYLGTTRLPYSNFDDPYLQDFENEVMDVIEQRSSGKFALSLTNFAKVKHLHEQSKLLYKNIPNTKECTATRVLFRENVNTLGRLRKEFENANIHLNGMRAEPVGVLIRGGPGVHKSTIMSAVAASVAAAVLSDEDFASYEQCPQNFEFNRQQENIYMDGYSPETITITFDDLGQAKDVAGTPDNEWMNIIRFINSFEAMGHAAAMEQKGVMRIRPKFVLATTNLIRISAQSIHDTNAIIRRFPISVTAVPKPEFKAGGSTGIYDQRFDYTKVPQFVNELGETTSNVTVNEFLFYNCKADGEVIGDPFDYNTLMDMIISNHRKRIQWHDKHVANFKELATEMRERFRKPEVQPQVFGFNLFNDDEEEDLGDLNDDGTFRNKAREIKYRVASALDGCDEAIRLKRQLMNNHHNIDFDKAVLEKNWLDRSVYFTSSFTHKEQFEYNNFYYNYSSIIVKDKEFYADFFEDDRDIANLDLHDILFYLWRHSKDLLIITIVTGERPSIEETQKIKTSVWTCLKASISFHYKRLGDIYHSSCKSMESFFNFVLTLPTHQLAPLIFLTSGLILSMCVSLANRIFGFKAKDEISSPTSVFVTNIITKDEEMFGKTEVKNESLFYEVDKSKKVDKPGYKSVHSLQKALRASKVNPQGDVAGLDIIDSILKKNTVRVFTYVNDDDNSPQFSGYGILLKKNYVLVPQHFVEKMLRFVDTDPTLMDYRVKLLPAIEDSNETIVVGTCSVSEFLDKSLLDMCDSTHTIIVNMPTRDCRDIINSFFISDNNAGKLSKTFNVSMTVPHRKMTYNSLAYKTEVEITDEGRNYTVPLGIRYHADTFSGDCGSPVFIRDARMQAHRIIGIHIAGSSRPGQFMAFSNFLTGDTINAVINKHKDHVIVDDLKNLTPVEPQSAPIFIADRFKVLGSVPHMHSPYGVTDIKKSRLQVPNGPYVSKMAIASLRPTDTSDPYKLALKNYCSNQSILDPVLKRHSTEDFKSFLFGCPAGKPRVLTLEESLWGDKDIEFSDAIKSSTSAGYPMKYDKINIKKTLFAINQPRDSTNPAFGKFATHINDLITKIKSGVRPLFIFTDNMKDQRVKLSKALLGVNRLFSGSPFDYLALSRMYFGAFAQWIHSNSGRNGMVTAINPFSSQWDEMAHHIRAKDSSNDPLACDGDFKHYDASMITDFAEEILHIINSWYNDDNDDIRNMLWLELINSRHIFNNIVFEWFGALPSGHPLTLIINCMNNHLIHRYVFFTNISTTVKFSTQVLLYVTGDDVLMAVSDAYKDKFNGVVVSTLMDQIGYIYTSANKEAEIVPFKKLSEVQFLKRSFRYEPLLGRYVGPLDIDSIVEIPLWTKKNDSLAITESNINEFLDELCLHSDEVWNKYAPDFQKAVQTLFPEFSQDNRVMDSRDQRLGTKMNVEINPFKVSKNKIRNPNVTTL